MSTPGTPGQEHLLTEVDPEGIAWLTFNRPAVRNASSIEMIDALLHSLLRLEADSSVRCVVLRGAGEHFMAGGDIGAFARIAESSPAERRAAMQERLSRSALIFTVLDRMRPPVIASVRGAVAGGGVGFLLSADLAVAAEDSSFVLSHVRLGLSPDGSSSWHLPRAIGMKKAKQMTLLAETVDAPTALAWGLVNWVMPAAEVEAFTLRIARQLASTAPEALAQAKALLNAAPNRSLAEQVVREGEAIGRCAETAEFVQGIQKFMSKRKP